MGLKDNWTTTDWLKDGDPDIYEGFKKEELFEMAVKAVADACDGLSPEDGVDPYLEMVASEPSRKNKPLARAMVGMSGCALTSLGLWRCLGVADELLWKEYRIGRAVTDVVEVGRNHTSWIQASPDTQPFGIGDVVLISSPEHVFSVVSQPKILEYRQESDGSKIVERFHFDAMHGGRKTKTGKQLIEVTDTEGRWEGKQLIIRGRSKATGIASAARRVMGFARTRDFEFRRSALLPPNWKDSPPMT